MATSSISRSVVWQLVGKFFLQGVAFVTTPIFTRILTPSDYGYTALYASWLAIFNLLVGLCTSGSIGNARIEYGEDKLSEYLSSIMTISLLSFVILLGFFLITNDWMGKFIGLSRQFSILIIVHSFFSYVMNFWITNLDQLKKVEKSVLISVSHTVLSICLQLFFVICANSDKAQAKIYGQILTATIYGIFFFIVIYIKGRVLWNFQYVQFCLRMAFPLVIHSVGHLIFAQSDRIMLKHMSGGSELGVYSVAANLCSVLHILCSALNTAWVPFYFDLKRDGKNEQILVHSRRYVWFYTGIVACFIFLAPDVYKFMTPVEYHDGIRLVPFFVLSNFLTFMYLFPVNFEFFMKKTQIIPIATILAAVINILVNWLLIPTYGLFGAAIGTVVAHFLLYIFHEIMARRIIGISYEYRGTGLLRFSVLCVLFVCMISFFYNELPVWVRWPSVVCIALWMGSDFIKKRSIF